MATRTIRAKLTCVFVIFLMAGETVLRRRLQISYGARIDMAFFTGHICMFAFQFEGKTSVTEVTAKGIHAIMTGEAICAEGKDMRLGEDTVNLTVTTVACV